MKTGIVDVTPLEAWEKKIARVHRAAEGLGKHVASVEKKLTLAKIQQNTALYAKTLLAGVLTGWKKEDPGKYQPAYRFIGASGRPVVAEELLSPEERAQARAKDIPVVSLEQVATDLCPRCGPGKLLPVIEEYQQTEDSYDGDTWMKLRLVVCPDCCAAFQVAEPQERGSRF